MSANSSYDTLIKISELLLVTRTASPAELNVVTDSLVTVTSFGKLLTSVPLLVLTGWRRAGLGIGSSVCPFHRCGRWRRCCRGLAFALDHALGERTWEQIVTGDGVPIARPSRRG